MSGLFNIDKGDGLCYFDDIHRWFSRPAGSWDVSVPNFPLYLEGASGEVGIWAYGRDITCSERPDSRKNN